MPSGRWIDSILMTSAPNAANECVAAGPAQKAVRSMRRTPANGSSAVTVEAADSLGCQRDSLPASPRAGAGLTGAGAAADIRQGGRGGCRHQPGCARLPEPRRVVDKDAALT